MVQKTINFDYKKVNKTAFYQNKILYNEHDIDTEKILVSKKDSYGKKEDLDILLDILMMKMISLDLYV